MIIEHKNKSCPATNNRNSYSVNKNNRRSQKVRSLYEHKYYSARQSEESIGKMRI
uniref:Uncharacterized protein n=1 Tax=Myoviridae sp. ctm8X17 TaxID=2825168 RepID=A0A8S5Q9S5_9CAUD|nr:MAG TPA: hypothetical protein [Myoviridae sp. ctm8X17]